MATISKDVFSSHVQSVSYDDETHELQVTWGKGKVSAYSDVPQEVALQVMNAWSVGSALHNLVKDVYSHRYI